LLLFRADIYFSALCWRPRIRRFGVSPKKAAAMMKSGRFNEKILVIEIGPGSTSIVLKSNTPPIPASPERTGVAIRRAVDYMSYILQQFEAF